jgi:hypothetical protein
MRFCYPIEKFRAAETGVIGLEVQNIELQESQACLAVRKRKRKRHRNTSYIVLQDQTENHVGQLARAY